MGLLTSKEVERSTRGWACWSCSKDMRGCWDWGGESVKDGVEPRPQRPVEFLVRLVLRHLRVGQPAVLGGPGLRGAPKEGQRQRRRKKTIPTDARAFQNVGGVDPMDPGKRKQEKHALWTKWPSPTGHSRAVASARAALEGAVGREHLHPGELDPLDDALAVPASRQKKQPNQK